VANRRPLIASPRVAPDLPLGRTDLERLIGDFESVLIAAGQKPSASSGYVGSALRFIRWLSGDYRPRNAAARPWGEDSQRRGHWTLLELHEQLDGYQRELEDARLRPLAVRTYMHSARAFVRWLAGDFAPRGPSTDVPIEPSTTSADVEDRIPDAASEPVAESHLATAGPAIPEDWFWEGRVQDAVVGHLIVTGWHIRQMADTATRARGHDIVAAKGDTELIVEVKGYPSVAYRDPRRALEPKRTHPSMQAKVWFADAVVKCLRIKGMLGDATAAALALPDFPRYRSLLNDTMGPLRQLGIGVMLVEQTGEVSVAIPFEPDSPNSGDAASA